MNYLFPVADNYTNACIKKRVRFTKVKGVASGGSTDFYNIKFVCGDSIAIGQIHAHAADENHTVLARSIVSAARAWNNRRLRHRRREENGQTNTRKHIKNDPTR